MCGRELLNRESVLSKGFLVILAIFAALRVILFSALFPLFNNVDEQRHVDLVVKYSHGAWPRGLSPIAPESADLFVRYSSFEYLLPVDATPDVTVPRFGHLSDEDLRLVQLWEQQTNIESGEPPLYYMIAAGWLRVGQFLGIPPALSMYWVRFLNAIPAASVVILAWLCSRLTFPEHPYFRHSAATLAAIFPQDAFYSVQSDAWSALWFGIAFYLILRGYYQRKTSRLLLLSTGLALSAATLTKLANLPLLGVGLLAGCFAILVLKDSQTRSARIARTMTFLFAAIAPVFIWILVNLTTFGDPFATRQKVLFLGWSQKPMTDWMPHPLFSFSGFAYFWQELLSSFWRGEFVWRTARIASSVADSFYWVSSTLALVVAICLLWKSRSGQKISLAVALGCCAAAIGFVSLLSLMYDFGACFYPSRELPFFTSGRLLLGALVPFILIYAASLDCLTRRWPNWLRYSLLAGIALFVTINEIVISQPAFSSVFNFFHLIARDS